MSDFGAVIGLLIIVLIIITVIFGIPTVHIGSYTFHHDGLLSSAASSIADSFVKGIEDLESPQIVRSIPIKQEVKTYKLLNIDGYYLGRGFINGDVYYVFQTDLSSKGNCVVPADETDIVVDGKTFVEVHTKVAKETIKSRVDGSLKNQTNTYYKYIVHIPTEKIRDYGVIKNEIHTTSFFPIVVPAL